VFAKAGAVLAAVVVVIVGVTGCSASQHPNEWNPSDPESVRQHAEASGFTEAAAAAGDGQISREEWGQLHGGWVTCMEKIGFAFDEPLVDPVNGREYIENRSYNGPVGGPSEQELGACDARYDFSVGQLYYDQNPAVMAPDLIQATRSCLDSQGVSYPGDETRFQDFFPANTSPQEAVESPQGKCVATEFKRLYPDVQSFALGF
jgi:hypothetical protein